MIPVASGVLPSQRFIGVLVRLSAWPIFWLAAKVLSPGHTTLVAAGFVLVTLVLATVAAKVERLAVLAFFGASIVVGAAVASIASPALARLGFGMAGTAALAVIVNAVFGAYYLVASAGATVVASRLTPTSRGNAGPPPLDARFSALAFSGPWFAIAALVVCLGAQVAHAHAVVPRIALVLAAAGMLASLVTIVVASRQLGWTRRIYSGGETIRVGVAAEDERVGVPRLATVEECDAAIIVGNTTTPYRSRRHVLALVPSSPRAVVSRFDRLRRGGVAALVLALACLGLSKTGVPSAIHGVSAPEGTVSLPERCRTGPKAITEVLFVPFGEPRAIDVREVARRYERLGVRTTVGEPIAESGFRVLHGQHVGEEILAEAKHRFPSQRGRITIVVTDRDMFLEKASWRYAFATRDAGREGATAVVSVARMTPTFPWLAPETYVPEKPACALDLHARASKMITRQVLFLGCVERPSDDPKSVIRKSVMSLDDLDQIEEY